MTFGYPRGLRGPVVQDALLATTWLLAFLLFDAVPLRALLLGAIPVVLGWGMATLHFPSRVEVDDDGITFCSHGRVHRFAWSEVTRVRVRRFLVKDRVLVRIEPSPAWSGRYWLLDSLVGYDALVQTLETRARSVAPAVIRSG